MTTARTHSRPPLAVPFYKGKSYNSASMSEPTRKPLHLTFTIKDDGKESSWLKEVQSIPTPTFHDVIH